MDTERLPRGGNVVSANRLSGSDVGDTSDVRHHAPAGTIRAARLQERGSKPSAVARERPEATLIRDQASGDKVDFSSAGERVSWENRVVEDHCLGLAAEEAHLHFAPGQAEAGLGHRIREPLQPVAGLFVMPKAVVSHR